MKRKVLKSEDFFHLDFKPKVNGVYASLDVNLRKGVLELIRVEEGLEGIDDIFNIMEGKVHVRECE